VIVNGADLVTEVAPHVALRTLFYLQGAPPPELAADRCVAVTETVMRKITGLESTGPGTLAAEVAAPALADFRRRGSDGMARLLVLERCQDPGNLVRALLFGAVLWTQRAQLAAGPLSERCTRPCAAQGTLLRTALALGWDGVFLLPGCADPFNDKSLKASRGAAFKLSIGSGSLQDWQDVVRDNGLACVAAEPHKTSGGGRAGGGGRGEGLSPAEVLQRVSDARVSLVLGSEGQGLTQEVLEHCPLAVAIPMIGEMESLNVAAAGAILMFALSAGAPRLLGDLASGLQPVGAAAVANGSSR
jgi:TrmH family RNA methyltransferase